MSRTIFHRITKRERNPRPIPYIAYSLLRRHFPLLPQARVPDRAAAEHYITRENGLADYAEAGAS